jgi:hypothetical protein
MSLSQLPPFVSALLYSLAHCLDRRLQGRFPQLLLGVLLPAAAAPPPPGSEPPASAASSARATALSAPPGKLPISCRSACCAPWSGCSRRIA